MTTTQILAIGGLLTQQDLALYPYLVAQARRARPRVGLLPTASADSDLYVARFYEHFSGLACEPSYLKLFGRVRDPERWVREQDVILVSGGNTKSMLALWREWGLDGLLRQAWQEGVVLAGFSAGAICWFEQGVTDSWADRLRPMPCLGLLPGSCCPHYDGEAERRPIYHDLVARGEIRPGIGIDDGAAVHFRDGKAAALVLARPNAGAYDVSVRDGVASETPLALERIRLG